MTSVERLSGTAVGTLAPSDGENNAGQELPPHLLKLPQGRWALWRCVGLRGAGFPIAELSKLATTEAAHKAEVVLAREAETGQARSKAIAALRSELEAGTHYQPSAIKKLIKRLQKSQPLAVADTEFVGGAALNEFRQACAHLDDAQLEFRQAFDTDAKRFSERLRQVAANERFREAVIWQSRRVFHTAIKTLNQPPGGSARGWKQRQREELVANYLQRYCAKNDTIGFFGPVGWASFVNRDDHLTLKLGAGLISSRRVYFEGWCIEALAGKLAADKAIRPWVAPRVRPAMRLDGNTLCLPFGGEMKLTPDQSAILQACDGTRTAKRIAEELICSPYTTFRSEPSVYGVLEFMCARKIIFWSLYVPIEAQPEQTLQRLLERIDDDVLRESAQATVAEIVAARDAVGAAAGSAEELDQAMDHLEQTFTRLTGIAPTRPPGSAYARTLVYEDCRRDLKLEIGNELLRSLMPPLHLLLKSARWLISRGFDIYRTEFEKIYERLTSASKSPLVDIASFWLELEPLIRQVKGEPLDTLVAEFQQRWSKILACTDEQRRVQYSTEDIRLQASALFDAPDDAAKYVRYHSPDVLIEARSIEAIQAGEYQLVLGELHAAVNTLSYLMFVEQHTAPEQFVQAWDVDIPERCIIPVLPKDFFGGAMRTKLLKKTAKDLLLDFANERPDPTPTAVPFSEFVIENSEGGLIVRTHDGQLRFDGMQFFAMAVVGMVTNSFKLVGRRRHQPRVNVDRLVVCRESWSFAASELEFAYETDEAARFLSIRRWATQHQMPRHVFITAPVERKPCYVDFDSAIYTDLFAKIVRRTAREKPDDEMLTITEMLPDPDNLWLNDAENNRYTSELRIVALDLAGWSNAYRPESAA